MRKSGVEQAQTVWPADFALYLEAVAASDRDRRGGPLPDAIERQHHRLLEGRGEESRGRVAQVMLREQQLATKAAGGGELGQRLLEVQLLEHFLVEPQRHRQPERAEALRGVGEISFQKALEF